jgi:hypothetical protein
LIFFSISLAFLGACASAKAPVAAGAQWDYVVTPPAVGEHRVEIEATFGATDWLVIPAENAPAVRDVAQRVGDAWRAATRVDDAWELTSCAAPCTVRYAIDLEALVKTCRRHHSCAMNVDGVTVAPVSSWILRPHATGARISMRTRGDGPFAFGMRRSGDGYAFNVSELSEGSYTAFGPLRKRRVARDDAAVEVALLGSPIAMGDDAVVKWIGDATDVLARFYGHFPIATTIFVLPVPGEAVQFGSVMALTGASVALFVGRDIAPGATRVDWVVVHELFHLGTPTFQGEGRWLDEGLATYYEPLLRARAGWTTEAELWQHFDEEMPRGVRPEGSAPSIEERRDIDSTYWGGALFAMLADVRIREATGGAKSLDDALRAASARGAEVTRVWSVREFLRVGDEATGTHVLSDLNESFAVRGDAVDVARELARAKKAIPAK